jgi:tripartite-type tricarboxylate transporter receptor subunit TctC
MNGFRLFVASAAMIAFSFSASADPVADFYRGKQVLLIVSTGTGGGYAEHAQAFAHYYGAHIPGNPSVVPQFMPGAGGIRAMNHLYANASKDGTAMGLVNSSMVTADIMFPEQAHFDTSKFNWLGNIDGEPALCVFWKSAGIDGVDDLKKREIVIGSSGVGSGVDKHPHMLNKLLGTRLKIVSGYTNGNEVNVAMERHEVEGRCGWSPDGIESTRPQWLTQNLISIPVQFGLTKSPHFADVPLLIDLVSDEKTKAALKLALAERDLIRPVLAPPGVANDRIAALRTAFMATMEDATFKEELAKRRLSLQPTSGEEVQKMIASLHAFPPDVTKLALDLSN